MAVVDVQAFRRQQRKMFSKGADSGAVAPPLLGGLLPVRRVIPIDVHAVMDYSASGALAAAGWLASTSVACTVGSALGLAGAGVSLLTDYRLSVKKLIPIEVHEVIDYLWGAAACLAPFVFRYAKRSPLVAAAHVLVGATTILGSLFTDYRGLRGVHWRSSPTTPRPVGA